MTDQPKIYSRFGIVKLKDGYAIRGSRLCSAKTRPRWWFFRCFDTIDWAYTRLPEFSITWDWLELTNEGKIMGYASYACGYHAKKHPTLTEAQDALKDFILNQLSIPLEDWSEKELFDDAAAIRLHESYKPEPKKPFIRLEINP